MSKTVQNLSASCLVSSPFEEETVRRAAEACLQRLGKDPDLVFAFVSSDYREYLPTFLESLQIDGHARSIAGGSGCGLIGVGKEQENISGFSLLFLTLPSTKLTVTTKAPVTASATTLVLARSQAAALESILRYRREENCSEPWVGGCITGGPDHDGLFLFDESGIVAEEALFVQMEGGVRVVPLSAPGCRPIGQPFIITEAKSHDVLSLSQREPLDLLEETFEALGTELQREAEGHIFAGLAIDEETEHFHAGDFRIHQIVGATLHDGRLRLEAPARTGQTLQFLWRDPLAAEMHLRSVCEEIKAMEGAPFASMLFAGKGRGRALFGVDDRNVATFEEVFGKLPVTGIHSYGEFAGTRSDLIPQSQSVSAALFYPAE